MRSCSFHHGCHCCSCLLADIKLVQVLVSFVLSALLTVGAVVCAYLSDSMPEKYLSKTDEAFIKEFQRIKKNLPFRLLPAKLRPPPTERQGKLSREKRVEAFDRFILSLSDQQLATGLAILIAAIANQCTLSPPEFRIAFSLAWFSTTTHLATLDSLRHYFTKHKTLRNVRVFGMLTFMVLFLYCFIVVLVMENSPDNIVPVQCHVQGSVRTYKDEEITLSTYFWPWAMTALIIIFAYKSKLLRTYSYGSNDFIGLGRYSKNVLSLWSRWRYPKEMQLPIMEPDQWNYVRKEAAEELFAGRRQRLLMDLVLKSKDPAFITELANAWKYAEYRYWHSMLPLVPPMTFMLVFGLAQMILFRWELGDYKAIEVDTSMGFGQIIPLILLALPFLAAAEIYQGRS